MIDATQPQVLVAEFEAVTPMKSVITREEFEALGGKVDDEIVRATEAERNLEELIKEVDVVDLGQITYKELESITENGVYRGVIVPSEGFTLKETIYDISKSLYFVYDEYFDSLINAMLNTTDVRGAACDNYFYNGNRSWLVAGVKNDKVVVIFRCEYIVNGRLPVPNDLLIFFYPGMELPIDSLADVYETFVITVINDNAVADEIGMERSISQQKYGIKFSLGWSKKHAKGELQMRKGYGNDNIAWDDWENIGDSYTLPIATTDVLGGIKASVVDDNITASAVGENYFDVVVDKRGKAFTGLQMADYNKLGIVRVYNEKGKVSSGPSGVEYSVNIRPNGQLYSTVNHADANNEGVIKVSDVVGEYIDTNPLGNRYGVNVGNDGVASVTIPYAEESTEGLVTKVHSLDTNNDDAVPTAKAVKDALDNIPQGGGSVDLSDYYTKEEIDNKPFVTTEPTTEELPDVPEYITRTDLDNAITEAITNTINTPV